MQRFSLACLGFSFLFRGVQRGYFSFQRERSEIMKADGLLISAEELPWRNPISACRSRLNEWLGGDSRPMRFDLGKCESLDAARLRDLVYHSSAGFSYL